ncbi:uncharacterized protein [Arachis hypogaea]|uniref:uncharacterized protein n=1 Tax=Arachis hypogaea TaxID=3818 RepID=UPI003B20F06A
MADREVGVDNPENSQLQTFSIFQSVLWCNVASELWNDLKHRFYEGDLFQIVDLQEEMFAMKQGDLSITAYFTKLKGIWEELDEFKPIPSCACGASCSCELKIIREYRDQEHAVRILRRLNEQYTIVKSQIMLIVLLPNVNFIYSLLLQQERQLIN